MSFVTVELCIGSFFKSGRLNPGGPTLGRLLLLFFLLLLLLGAPACCDATGYVFTGQVSFPY